MGPKTDFGWEVYPQGLYDLLKRLHVEYNVQDIIITENGCSYSDGPDENKTVNDTKRIEYHKSHVEQIKIAVNDGFNIIFEYSTRKTFTDYLDDVSTTFPGQGLQDMSEAEWEMSDPLGTHLKDDQRGNSDKNDWYSFAGITPVSYTHLTLPTILLV